MSSTRAREGRDAAEVDDLEDLSDEELDALLAEELAEREEEEEEVPVPRSGTTKKAPKASKKKSAKAAADARTRRSNQDSRADGPPTGTALVMLAVSAVSAIIVFAMRAARRKQSPAPKRADTPAPTLAVDGAHTSARKSDVTPTRRLAAAKKKPVPAAARRCANCGATAPKKKDAPSGVAAATKLLRCGGCRATYYCSSECQRQHRPVHKKDCVPPAGTQAAATRSATAGEAPRAPPPAVAAASPPEPAAPADAAAAAAAAEGARRFQSLRARLGAATVAFSRGATGQAVSALQDIAMEAHELFDRHALGRDIECEALRVAGHGMIRMRAWEPAEKCLDACLGVARLGLEDDPPLPPGAAIGAFVALGTLASAREPPEFDLSQQWFAHALQVAREAGDVAAEASVCQSLAGVAGKMGDGAAAAQAAEMALGLRRAKLEEAGRTLVAAEEALAAFTVTVTQSQAPPSVGTEDAADPTPQPGSEAIGVAPATGGRPATAPPITSPDHARAFGAAAAAKRALAEARRAEVAALANVGAALLKVPATSGPASGAAEASEASSEDAPLGTDVASKTEDAGDAPRDPSPATRVAAGVARYEEALASLRRDAAGPQDLEMEIGLLLELANAHDNRVGGDAGRARARLARASLREAVKALTANQREFPNTCTLCSETMDVIENEGEVDTHASTTGSGPDAAAATRPVTCLECLHGYHSACLLRWREEKLVEELEKMEKAKGEGEDVSGREPQKPRCPDCAKIHASRAAAAEAAQRQPRSSASAPGGFL